MEVARQWPRRVGAGEVERDRNADHDDSVEFELVAHPPAEIEPAHRQRRHKRRPQPHEPHHDRQVAPPAREHERAQRPQGDDREAAKPESEQRERGVAALRGNGGESVGKTIAETPSTTTNATRARAP